MSKTERRTSINYIIEAMEEEKLDVEKEFFVVLIYRTILGYLREPHVTNITGKKVLKIIEETKDTPRGIVLRSEAVQLRRKRQIEKGVERAPSVQDIKEVTEGLMQECRQLNKNAKRHCSFLVKRIFPKDSE